MKRALLPSLLGILPGPIPSFGQTQAPPLLCDIKDASVEATATFNAGRRVYVYEYAVVSGAQNTGNITSFDVEVSAEAPQNPADPDLRNDSTRIDARPPANFRFTPVDAVPAGLASPNAGWVSSVGPIARGLTVTSEGASTVEQKGAMAGWSGSKDPVRPGERKAGFTLETKAPPALRAYTLKPSWSYCLSLLPEPGPDTPEDSWPEGVPDLETFTIPGTTIGPMLETDGVKYNGGGQKPSDVNQFLWYRTPTEARTDLPAGTTTYDVIVNYGGTTLPATFAATLNGTDVKALFKPAPGVGEIVRIPIAQGSNKLQLSIEGATASGRIATDTDSLTLLVP